jgi:acyl transferase domain-containing protein
MLEDLVRHGPLGIKALEQADELLGGLLPRPISSYIYPRPDFEEAADGRQQAALDDTRVAQPAIGVMSLFAMDLLLQFGLRPAFVAGHSYGEYVALCAAGLNSREDLLRISALCSRAVYEAGLECPGGMVAVAASETDTQAALDELGIPAKIANVNAPRHVVVAGPADAIDAVLEQLPARGFVVRRVSVTSAFHTAALEPTSIAFEEHLQSVPMALPRIPVYSNATAAPYPADIGAIRHQMAHHLARPVRFVELLQALHRDGAHVFLEVGPAKILTGLVGRTLNGRPHTALALDMRAQPSWSRLGLLLAHTHALGLPIDLSAWFEPFALNAGNPHLAN